PGTLTAGRTLLTLSRLATAKGDRQAAVEYLQTLADGNYSAPLKAAAQRTVAAWSGKNAEPEPVVAEPHPRQWWPAVIAMNAAALTMIVIGWLVGRWRRSQQ
ncbi:MAG: hypothetical protein ACF8TS_03235, partial [Maioricimonas sp. JB049]